MALSAVEKLPLPSKKSSADWSVGIKLSFVTDPHAAFGAWQGCEVVGGGMNYDAIDRAIAGGVAGNAIAGGVTVANIPRFTGVADSRYESTFRLMLQNSLYLAYSNSEICHSYLYSATPIGVA